MTTKYETLDEYLDALDAIKEQVAKQTRGMTVKQVKAYFGRAEKELEKTTRSKVRVRRHRQTRPVGSP
jgi:glycine cleavage system protein P-like pyridoxal-binding family